MAYSQSTPSVVKILLVHQNFPGQFRGLAPELLRAGHEVQALSSRAEPLIAGVPNTRCQPACGNAKDLHPWLASTESAVLRGEAVAAQVERLHASGWTPDRVLGHTGWGEMMFLRQVLPRARLLGFNELYYRASGGDVGFDPEFPPQPGARQRLVVRNLHLVSSLLACDAGITPTQWQAQGFPPVLRERLHVIHDGVDTDRLAPDPSAWIRLGRGNTVLRQGDEVITFVNRNLEPMRGYHQFMRALPGILARRPRARVVIVGGNEVSYGAAAPEGRTWREIFLDEVRDRIDLSRVHYVGRVPYDTLVTLLRVSAVHVYLTVPFVLSWSMLEAMSLGALVVGSDTAPVREVVEHGRNGLLVDFFRPDQLADQVCEVLARPAAFAALRTQARQDIIDRYDFRRLCLPRYMDLVLGG